MDGRGQRGPGLSDPGDAEAGPLAGADHGALWRTIYLQGIDSSEIISTVHGRPSPTISASAGLLMTP